MPTVSVPEKTLEHWSSQYLTYRYRSKAAMWWPTKGVDIDVKWLPHCAGKAVQLELKTTTVAGTNLQDVIVNLGQLWEYAHRPLAHQPYYVFPWPDWTGELEAAATAAHIPATELAFSRSGPGWWFAEWMVVLTTNQVAQALAPELSAHGSPQRKNAACRLVRFELATGSSHAKRTWGAGSPEPPSIPWRLFWTTLQACGRDGWPQLIRLPADAVTSRDYRRSEIAALLEEFRQLDRQAWRDVELVTMGPMSAADPNEPDVFRVIDDLPDERETPTDERANGEADRRQVVFLEAGARGTRR